MIFATTTTYPLPPYESIIILPVVTITKEMKSKKWRKLKINVGTLVKSKVVDMEDNKREVINMRTRENLVSGVQYVTKKNNFLVQFEDAQKRDISSGLLPYICSE